MQLIVHLPMVRTRIPSVANLFLLDYLSVVRLHLGNVSELLVEELGLNDSNMEDFSVIRSEEPSYYNELIHACGYHVSLVHNLIFFGALFAVLLLLWLLVACKDSCLCCRTRHEKWWNNVLIRFLLEVFFELSLCLMISFTAVPELIVSEERDWYWGLAVGLGGLVLMVLAILGICCLAGVRPHKAVVSTIVDET